MNTRHAIFTESATRSSPFRSYPSLRHGTRVDGLPRVKGGTADDLQASEQGGDVAFLFPIPWHRNLRIITHD